MLSQSTTATGDSSSWRFSYYPQLEGFRGLSIVVVLIAHTAFPALGPLGGLGVMMFFVLSGFLITGLLIKERTRSGNISLSRFYRRRALRIFPAFFTFMAIVCLLISLGYITDVGWPTVAVVCLYLSNMFGHSQSLAHIWSLSLEEQFYAVWPVLFRAARHRILWLAGGLFLFVGLSRAIAIGIAPDSSYFTATFYERPWFRFDSILIGCCLALILYTKQPDPASIRRMMRPFAPVVVFLAALLWTMTAEHCRWLRPCYQTVQMSLMAALLLHLIAWPTSFAARLLSSHPLRWLGGVSYSLYLWQQPFLITRVPNWGFLRHFPWNLVCLFSIGISSHYLIERPFLKLKDRLSHPIPEPNPSDLSLQHLDSPDCRRPSGSAKGVDAATQSLDMLLSTTSQG